MHVWSVHGATYTLLLFVAEECFMTGLLLAVFLRRILLDRMNAINTFYIGCIRVDMFNKI